MCFNTTKETALALFNLAQRVKLNFVKPLSFMRVCCGMLPGLGVWSTIM